MFSVYGVLQAFGVALFEVVVDIVVVAFAIVSVVGVVNLC